MTGMTSHGSHTATQSGSMLVRRHDPSTMQPSVVIEWQQLATTAAEINPFAGPAFVLPAMRHLRGPSDSGRMIATVHHDGRMVACVPLVRTRRWRKIPLPAVGIHAHAHNPLGTPLVDTDPVVAAEAAAALLDDLAGRGSTDSRLGAPLLFTLDEVGDGPALRAFLAAASTAGMGVVEWESHERAVLLAPDRQSVAALLEGRHRRLPGKVRALERAVGGPVQLTDRSEDPTAIEEFLKLEASGWKGREGTAIASDATHAAFFTECCQELRALGQLDVVSLETPVGSVAMHVNVMAGEGGFHLKSAFDESYGRRSPGLQLLVGVMERVGESPQAWFDSCTDPENAVFNDLFADRRTIRRVVVVLGPRPLAFALRAAARLRSALAARRDGDPT